MAPELTQAKKTQSPVLFLVFNRPGMTAEVFKSIRKAKPDRLYIAGDGPRAGVDSDIQLVEETRRIATQVDWPCRVETLFRESNLGCKEAVAGAVSWFFENEPEGIILEDDTVPNSDFFVFCESLLERYRHDTRVAAITGDNFQKAAVRGDASYYFSRYPHVWGWASWRRAWHSYDPDMKFWPRLRKEKLFRGYFLSVRERRYWTNIFDKVYRGVLNTSWDYPWMAVVFSKGWLVATPKVNLISNIGFGPNSTHTKDSDSILSNIPSQPLPIIKHPKEVLLDNEADRDTFDHAFDVGLLQGPMDFIKAIVSRLRREWAKAQDYNWNA